MIAVWCIFICHGCEIPSPGHWTHSTIHRDTMKSMARDEGWHIFASGVTVCPDCFTLLEQGIRIDDIPLHPAIAAYREIKNNV